MVMTSRRIALSATRMLALCVAMTSFAAADGRDEEIAAFERFADLAVTLPPEIRTSHLEHYSTNKLGYALNNGLAMTSKGRLWASWIAGEDGPNAYTVASFSDDEARRRQVADVHDNRHCRLLLRNRRAPDGGH